MKFYINVNLVHVRYWELNKSEAFLFPYLYTLSSWAKEVIFEGSAYHWASKRKILEDMPILGDNADTIYRLIKGLEKKDLVKAIKIGKHDYIRITTKGSEWENITKEMSEKFLLNSEKNPSKTTPNSEKNPSDTLLYIDSYLNREITEKNPVQEEKQNTSSPLKAKNVSTSENIEKPRAHAPARDPSYDIEPDNVSREDLSWLEKGLTKHIQKNPIPGYGQAAYLVAKPIAEYMFEKGFKRTGKWPTIPDPSKWISGYLEDNPPELERVDLHAASKCMIHLLGGKKEFQKYARKYPEADAHMWHAYQFGMNDDIHPIPMYVVDDYPLGQDFYEWKKKEGSYFTNQAYYDRLLVYLEKKFPL